MSQTKKPDLDGDYKSAGFGGTLSFGDRKSVV